MTNFRPRLRSFAVRGVFWRKCLDWAISNVPFYFHPLMIFFWTIFFFIFSASVRRAVVHNLGIVLPESARVMNYLRAFRTFYNFAWTMADTAVYKLLKTPFSYELVGENFLDELAAANGAIILTAHMGSYDLGAALFAEKFAREIRMVRAPEPDELSAQHVDLSLEKAAGGGVKVDYSGAGAMLSLDLLNALRNGEIVSIQGDRVLGNVASSPVPLFGKKVFLPSGPFILALTTAAPIYPLFIVRSGYRTYKVIVQESIVCARTGQPRADDLGIVMQGWSEVLERVISRHWEQWYAFAPIF
jgi:lauroyl/myristoyl acyltransferase